MKPEALVFIAVGLFTAIGAIADWDWFMNNYRARFFVSIFGREGARIIYGVLGATFLILGVMRLMSGATAEIR